MADEPNIEPTSQGAAPAKAETQPPAEPPVAPPPAPAPPAKVYTQTEVEQMISERVARERRRISQSVARPEENPRPKNGKSAKTNGHDQEPELAIPDNGPTHREWRTFERAVAPYGLTDRQIQVIEDQFLDNLPAREDVPSFVATLVAELGWKKSDPPPTQRDAQPVAPSPAEAPVPARQPNPKAVDNAAPAPGPSYKQIVNPEELTKDQVAQILNEHKGKDGPKYLRQMAENYYRGKRITPPPPK